MLFRPLAVSALLALGLTAAQAEDFTPATTTVVYGDLNLSQPADAKVLAARLQDAARSVCLKANADSDAPAALQACTQTAISVAMAQIRSRMDQTVETNLVNVRLSMETP